MQADDLPALAKFYCESFGFAGGFLPNGELIIEFGETTVVFTQAEEGTHPFYHFAFNIPNNQLAGALDYVKDRAEILPFQGKSTIRFEDWDADAVFFLDPCGNIVEFIARHTLDNASDEGFGTYAVIGMSEMGFNVDPVIPVARELEEAFGLSAYRTYADYFGAVGDEEGLFILSRSGRNWLPTETPGVPYPAALLITGAKKGSYAFGNGLFLVDCL